MLKVIDGITVDSVDGTYEVSKLGIELAK